MYNVIILKLSGLNKTFFLVLALVVLAAFSALFFFLGDFSEKTITKDCSYRIEKETVRGTSLSGLVEDGDEVFLHYGYFECGEIERGDIVAYSYAGNENPIIKIIKAVPGDKFELKEEGGKWKILVNGESAKNSTGEEYVLGERAHKMLSLYERDYGGAIPSGAYLLLGNLAGGTLDSTHFGLVSKEDILGAILPY